MAVDCADAWVPLAIKTALFAARDTLGQCAPNPCVAACVLRDGKILATAAHQGCGQAHAEVLVLDQMGEAARGATLLVTLEPCCHHGRTPPCTDRIIAAGIARVVFCVYDPNPVVCGQGQATLRAAGIVCDQVHSPEVLAFYEPYLYWVEHQKPYFQAKLALSADGKTANADGSPVAITGPEMGQWTARRRQQVDAIITSARTITCDNPRFNVRLSSCNAQRPLWVLDSTLSCPLDARIWETAASVTLLYDPQRVSADTLAIYARRAQLKPVASEQQGHLSWPDVLRHLSEAGYHNVLLEAGATSTLSAAKGGYLNELHLSLTTKVLGESGLTAFHQPYDFYEDAKTMTWQCIADTAVASIKYQ